MDIFSLVKIKKDKPLATPEPFSPDPLTDSFASILHYEVIGSCIIIQTEAGICFTGLQGGLLDINVKTAW